MLHYAATLGYDALNITHPCKQLVIEHLDRVAEQAARVGAVNTVMFSDQATIGYNTDPRGFATALATGLPGAAKDVVQIGAGGAGAAVADALLESGVEALTIVDRDEARAAVLAEGSRGSRRPGARERPGQAPGVAALRRRAGALHPDGHGRPPGPAAGAGASPSGLWVADIVYRPLETALLVAARAAGCRVLHGGYMAVHQAAETLRLITGLQPDVPRMLATFAGLVDRSQA